MVFDGISAAATAASLIMNGFCCMYQMQEEEERWEAFREDIRDEFERQRMIDKELWELQDPNLKLPHYCDTSLIGEKRREKLLFDKAQISMKMEGQQNAPPQLATVRQNFLAPLQPPSKMNTPQPTDSLTCQMPMRSSAPANSLELSLLMDQFSDDSSNSLVEIELH